MDAQAIENKLSAARTRLILDKPFLGALVLRLPLVATRASWCETTATDARKFYYNPDYIQALRPDETQFVLAHEALHCALSHFARRQHRNKHRWDIACDYAINPLLIRDGLKPPPGSLIENTFEGMTAEEIYPCLEDNSDEKDTLDDHVYDDEDSDEGTQNKNDSAEGDNRSDGEQQSRQCENNNKGGQDGSQASEIEEGGGDPRPSPLTSHERETLSVQWQQRLAGAAQQAMQAGKLGGAMARMVDFMLQPKLPWRMLLARYMNTMARDDYSYTRPNLRRGDPAIYPSLRSAQVDMVIALDVSGSVSEKDMHEFLAEIDAIKGQLRARITLLACDADLSGDSPWVFEPWEDFTLPRSFHGGGGTNFQPVFNWVDNRDSPPELLVYFTDAESEFPVHPPAYPVIWLIKGKAKVPWGQRIQLN